MSATQLSVFLCIPFVFMANFRAFEDAVHTTLPGSPTPSSSNVSSPYGSASDLQRTVSRAITMDEKSTKSTYSYRFSWKTSPELTIASRRFPRMWPPRRLRSQELNKLLGASQLALPPWKQMQPPAPAAPTRQDLGLYLDIVMAPQPLGPSGPMAQGHLTTTGTQDVDTILSQALKMNMHEVPSYYSFRANSTTLEFLLGSIASGKSPTFQHATSPSGITAKQAPCQSDSYSKTRATCLDFVARYKDDGIPYEVDSPLCNVRTNIAVRQSKSLEDREIGKRFAHLWKAQSTKIQAHLTSVHKFSVLRIAGTEWGNQYSDLLLVGTNSCLILLLLICVFLALPMMHCDRLFVKPAVWLRIERPMCDGRLFASSPFRRRVEAPLFAVSPFGGLCDLRSL